MSAVAEVEPRSVEQSETSAPPAQPAEEAKPKRAEPVDYVQMVNSYVTNVLDRANSPEEKVAAEILEQRNKVARLNVALLHLERAMKQLRDKVKMEVETLDDLETDARAAQERPTPLFDGAVPSGSVSVVTPGGGAVDDTAWRDTKLSDIGIKPGILKALAEHEPMIETLGALVDWQGAKGDFWAKDIKGIGEKAQEEIAEACDRFWASYKPPVAASYDFVNSFPVPLKSDMDYDAKYHRDCIDCLIENILNDDVRGIDSSVADYAEAFGVSAGAAFHLHCIEEAKKRRGDTPPAAVVTETTPAMESPRRPKAKAAKAA